MKIKKRNIVTIILSAFCAVLLACSISMLTGLTSRNAYALKSDNDLKIGELTQKNYNSTTKAVFDRDTLNSLFYALSGGGGKTLQAVENYISTSTNSTSYGYKQPTTLPKFRTATDLFNANSGQNIVVDLYGQEFAVSFLTTDNNGDVIATLWMTQPLKDSSGTILTGKFGWATNTYSATISSTTLVTYTSNAYSTSLTRIALLNGGASDGSDTHYAKGTTNANVTSLSETVTSATRKASVLAPFTLNNSALIGTSYANKSLINFFDTPSQLEYTYCLDWPYENSLSTTVSPNALSYYLSEALTDPMKLSTSVGSTSTAYASISNSHIGAWWDTGVLNYATSTVNGYNDWGEDYVWLPSLAETGHSTVRGLWGTGLTTTDQIKFNDENLSDGSTTLAASTSSTDRVWLRSGDCYRPYFTYGLSSSNSVAMKAYTGATMAVRPALHLNLTAADENAKMAAPSDISKTTAYDGTSKEVTYNGSQQTLSYLAPDWYTNSSDYYDDTTRVKLTYEFIKQGDTTTTFKEPALGDDGINQSLVVDPNVATDLKDAGQYKITIELLDSGLKWADDLLNYDTATTDQKQKERYRVAYFTIAQKEIEYTWDNIGLNTDWEVEFAQTFTPATGKSAAPWVFLEYTLPVTADNTATPSATTTKIPYVVLKFTGSDAQFGDNVIENIDNVRGGESKGSNYPQHADNYTVSFEDKNAKTSNYKLVPADGEKATRTYSITRMKVTAPVEQSASASAAKEYTANELSFTISKFDPKYMTYGTLDTDGVTYLKEQLPQDDEGNDLYSLVAGSTTGLTLKATQADKYYVYYRLLTETNTSGKEVVRDYMWSDAKETDPAPVRKVTYEITPKTLEFTFTSSATSGSWTIKANDEDNKLTYAYAAGKGPATPNGGDTEEPVLEIWFYYTTDGDSGIEINPDNATTPNELLFKNLINSQGKHATGSYTVVIKLADSDKFPVNKNYMTKVDDNDPAAALATYTKAVTISEAEASLDDIKTVYKDSTMGENDDAKELPVTDTAAGTKNLQYVYDESTKKAVEYFITLDFSEISYLQTSGAYTYKYSNGTSLAVGSGFAKADTVTVTVNISVKASEQADNKLPAESDYTGTKFKYTRIDDYNGTLTFTYTIDKGDVSEDAIKTPSLQYRYSGESDSEWKDYDPDKLPEYNGKNIEFQIKKPYPTGVTGATIESTGYLGNRKGPGSLSFMVNYEVDDNYNTIKTQTYTVKISEQIIDMGSITYDYIRDENGDLVKDEYGSPYQLPVVKFDDPTLSQYVTYEYYLVDMTSGTPQAGALIGTGDEALQALIDPNGSYKVNSKDSLAIMVRPVIDTSVSGSDKYALKDVTGKTITDEASGLDGFVAFTLGDCKDLAIVDKNKTSSVFGDSVNASDILKITDEDGNLLNSSLYNLFIYKNSISAENYLGTLAEFDFKNADAGLYIIEISLTDEDSYALTESTVKFTIEKKEIPLPTLGDIIFSGKTVDLVDYLGGSYLQYKNIIDLSGDIDEIRNVSKNGYTAVLTITDSNYKWASASTAVAVSFSLAKAVAADNEISAVSDDMAQILWNITPLVVDTTNLWNKSASGATLNLPQTVKDLIAGGTLAVGYRYYDGEGTLLDDVELKGGRSFKVEAVFTGDDAERNVQFKTSDTEYGAVSKSIDYTVPQSGAAAFMNSVKEFMTKTWLGLPVWAWFLIGLALLILLIIIIAVACKRRKSKEEREEIKARKEEEKARREEERQMQREKLEAERELAKAKQEAELEKIRMQAQMSAGAGMASMAMQQQPQPQQPQQAQPVQQPQPQQIPVPQYTTDGAVLAEIRAELAEIKARQNMSQSYSQPPMQMPVQMPMPMPMAMPQYMPMPQSQSGGNGGYEDARLLLAEERARTAESRLADERARAAEEKSYRSMEERAMLAEERFVRGNGMPVPQIPAQTMPVNQVAPVIGNNPEFIGAVIASALRNSGVAPAAITSASTNAEPQQIEEKSVATAPAIYPSDAVITTTTTVDTTKGKPVMRQREQDTNFDVDGFYDKYE